MNKKLFRNTKNIFIIMPILLILMMILNMVYSPFSNFAKAETNDFTNNEISLCAQEAEGISVKPKLENELVSADSIFTLSYETNLHNFKTPKYEAEGIDVLGQSVIDNTITFKTLYNGESDKIKLTIFIEDVNESGNTLSTSVFGIKFENQILLNTVSFDNAWSQYYLYQFQNGVISDEEYQEKINSIYHNIGEAEIKYNEVVHSNYIPEEIVLYGSTKTVSGYLKWKDDNGTIHPLQYCQLQLFDAVANELLSTYTYTDENGAYNFSLPITRLTYVKVYVYAAGQYVTVKPLNQSTYYYASDTLDLVANDDVVMSWCVDMNSETGQAFQIAQAAIFASKYYNYVFSYPTQVSVIYPYASENCFYANDRIYIRDANEVNGDLRSYNSWDVIMHEYGHHVQKMQDYSFCFKSTGMHSFEAALQNILGENGEVLGKGRGGRLAWQESIATVFSGMAQDYFISQLDGIKYVGDNQYSSYNGAYLNYETSQVEKDDSVIKKGETCEATIIGVMWDIYDNSSETHDKLYITHMDFYTTLKKSSAKSFYEYIDYFLSARSANENNKLGSILEYYNLSPQNLTVNGFTFSWSSNNDAYSYNSAFQVRFYDTNNVELYASEIIHGTSIAISKDILKAHLSDTTNYVRVFGYDATTPESCFFSGSVSFYLPRENIVQSKTVRTTEYRIKDDGYMSNNYDSINLYDFTGYNTHDLKIRGYTKVTIDISISVREINDGYQHIAIYDSSSSNAKQLASEKFEHGHLRKDGSTWTHNFTFTIMLDDMGYSNFYIRYSASGVGEDDWVNSNLNVKLTIS